MANGNNGNGRNGRKGGGNAIQVATLISLAVLVMGMFGFWWASADPRARLDKIEANQIDNRKELNEVITSLRKDLGLSYTSLREHNDLQARIKAEMEAIEKKDASLLTRGEFEAWKLERDKRIAHLEDTMFTKDEFTTWRGERDKAVDQAYKRLENDEDAIKVLQHNQVSRGEHEARWAGWNKTDDTLAHRIDILQTQLDKLHELMTVNPTDILNKRIDQLYILYREIQQQQFELHGSNPKLIPQPQR